MDKMTSKERCFAAIEFKGIDKAPFYPKIKLSYKRAQIPPYKETDQSAITAVKMGTTPLKTRQGRVPRTSVRGYLLEFVGMLAGIENAHFF